MRFLCKETVITPITLTGVNIDKKKKKNSEKCKLSVGGGVRTPHLTPVLKSWLPRKVRGGQLLRK